MRLRTLVLILCTALATILLPAGVAYADVVPPPAMLATLGLILLAGLIVIILIIVSIIYLVKFARRRKSNHPD